MKNNSLQKNRLQKKITKNQLLHNDTQLIRVLDIEADRVFVIDCIKKTMPVWKDLDIQNQIIALMIGVPVYENAEIPELSNWMDNI